jgi:RNA polymerase sigma-70 factor (ECF subfamily)
MSEMLDDREIRGLLLRSAARDAGSAEAFERLYKLAAPLLLGVAKRILGRAELAEEVLHDAFAKIWHAAGSFDPLAAQPVAWMVAIVRNRAIDTKASHDVSRVDSYHDAAGNDPDGALDRIFEWAESTDEAEDRRRAARWLRDCLARLQAAERQALVLAYQHGLSHGELAAHLAKPLGTVKTWVRRGMASLRQCVETCMEGGR